MVISILMARVGKEGQGHTEVYLYIHAHARRVMDRQDDQHCALLVQLFSPSAYSDIYIYVRIYMHLGLPSLDLSPFLFP